MMIEASLNEVETLAAKSARGAGLAWGLAEEVGKSARWLAACGLEWAPSLVRLLEGHAALAAPLSLVNGQLQSSMPGVPMSPLLTGAYLDDLGASAGELDLEATASPLWLLPFAARTADAIGAAVVVGWAGVSVTVWPYGGDITGDEAALDADTAVRVTWAHLPPGGVASEPTRTLTRAGRSRVATADWQALARLSAHTYVPASEISRAKGAGAGAAVDND